MAPARQARIPLSDILPPLICGTATFNNQYNPSVEAVPTNAITAGALASGIHAFDTSPYYGPSETLLGTALQQPAVVAAHPRSSYYLLTKVGRIAGNEFDYSPAWVRYSIARSLARLHTTYLDVVYCHDVEFVTAEEVLAAVRELRRIRDTEGSICYIGISGYPVELLCDLAERVLRETGEPLDAVMSYANFTLQSVRLASCGIQRLRDAGVSVVPNASPLGMGLMRTAGVPIGATGDFHPAPQGLRDAVARASAFVQDRGERLEVVSIRWALDEWSRQGAAAGSKKGVMAATGVSVMGCSSVAELDETVQVWNSVLDGLEIAGRSMTPDKLAWSTARRAQISHLATSVWDILGSWKDFAWESPGPDYVNMRTVKGVVDKIAPMASTDAAAGALVSEPIKPKESSPLPRPLAVIDILPPKASRL